MRQRSPIRQADIARKAGVSRACVSLVLNPDQTVPERQRIPDQTAQRIRRLATKMGYRPNLAAQQLAGVKSSVLGLLLDARHQTMPPARMTRIIFAMEQTAFDQGYRLLIGNTHDLDQVTAYLDDFESRRVEGVACLYLDNVLTDRALSQRLAALGNVVYLEPPGGARGADYVEIDYAAGVRAAVAHLAKQGRRRVGIQVYSPTPPPMAGRLAGYDQGVAEAGLPAETALRWTGTGDGLPHPQLIDQIIDQVVVGAKGDAIIASNDGWAVALIKRLKARGISVPGQAAVVGFDNVADVAEALDPTLTSIDHNDEQIGAELMKLLLAPRPADRDRDRTKPRRVVVTPRLVVRESA